MTGRAMADELELVHKDDLEDRRGTLSPATISSSHSGSRGLRCSRLLRLCAIDWIGASELLIS